MALIRSGGGARTSAQRLPSKRKICSTFTVSAESKGGFREEMGTPSLRSPNVHSRMVSIYAGMNAWEGDAH